MFLLNAQLRSCVSIFHDLIANRIFFETFKIAWSQHENDRWKVWEKKWEKKLNWSQVHADLSNFAGGSANDFLNQHCIYVRLYRSLDFVSLSTLFLDSINLCLSSLQKIRSFCQKLDSILTMRNSSACGQGSSLKMSTQKKATKQFKSAD